MAGAIVEHKAAGRPVWLVLITDGSNDGLLQVMNGQIPCGAPGLHGSTGPVWHSFNLTMEQLEWARSVEFVASAKALGVDEVFIVNDAQGLHSLGMPPAVYQSNIKEIITRFEARAFSRYGVRPSHKFVTGTRDPVYEVVTADGGTTVSARLTGDHVAIEQAALDLLQDGIINDARFYRVNAYSNPSLSVADDTPDLTITLSPAVMAQKQAALNEYKLFLPVAGRYALGFHSIGYTLFENPTGAYFHDKEYLDCPPSGC